MYVLGEKEPYKSAEASKGIDTHKFLEDRLIGNKPLPAEMARIEPLASSFTNKRSEGWEIHAEYQMAVDYNYGPIDYWDKSGRLFARGNADVIALPPTRHAAVVADWKDGKRRDKSVQLERLGLFVFSHFPSVEFIFASNVWLQEGKPGPAYTFTRSQLPEMRANVQKILDRVDNSAATGVWPENPGPLCGFCHVKSCRFNRS